MKIQFDKPCCMLMRLLHDEYKLDPVHAHGEDLGTKIYRPQSGSSCWIPYMLSVHGEATHRGETSFL